MMDRAIVHYSTLFVSNYLRYTIFVCWYVLGIIHIRIQTSLREGFIDCFSHWYIPMTEKEYLKYRTYTQKIVVKWNKETL